jgi:hypothetical protein
LCLTYTLTDPVWTSTLVDSVKPWHSPPLGLHLLLPHQLPRRCQDLLSHWSPHVQTAIMPIDARTLGRMLLDYHIFRVPKETIDKAYLAPVWCCIHHPRFSDLIEAIARMSGIERVLMCRGELSVYKAVPLRIELMDNAPLTYTQPLGLPLHSQNVPGFAVRPSQPLDSLGGDRL